MPPKLKTIIYRGGIARFSLPAHWVEEYEPEGGGTFYEDRPDSGTLRLSVLQFESPSKTAEQMALDAFKEYETQPLPSGFALHRLVRPAEENGETLNIHRWHIAVPVPPRSLRIVVFAHTLVAGQETDPQIAEELRLLDECIRAGNFSQEAGVSGSFYHDKNP